MCSLCLQELIHTNDVCSIQCEKCYEVYFRGTVKKCYNKTEGSILTYKCNNCFNENKYEEFEDEHDCETCDQLKKIIY